MKTSPCGCVPFETSDLTPCGRPSATTPSQDGLGRRCVGPGDSGLAGGRSAAADGLLERGVRSVAPRAGLYSHHRLPGELVEALAEPRDFGLASVLERLLGRALGALARRSFGRSLNRLKFFRR